VLIPLHRILMPPNMPAGMDWSVIGHFVMLLRKLPQPVDPPIEVEAEGDYWRIKDGRHRFVAANIAGRTVIDAEPVKSEKGVGDA